MPGIGRDIGEVVLPHRLCFLAIVQDSGAAQHKIEFFLVLVADRSAGTLRIHKRFAESGDALERLRLGVALTEDRRVVTRICAEIGALLRQPRDVAAQPGGRDLAFLARRRRCDGEEQEDGHCFH